jgi:hypothetical protein
MSTFYIGVSGFTLIMSKISRNGLPSSGVDMSKGCRWYLHIGNPGSRFRYWVSCRSSVRVPRHQPIRRLRLLPHRNTSCFVLTGRSRCRRTEGGGSPFSPFSRMRIFRASVDFHRPCRFLVRGGFRRILRKQPLLVHSSVPKGTSFCRERRSRGRQGSFGYAVKLGNL